MTADEYINQVLDMLPPGTPRREQIVMELAAHIAEATTRGTPLAEVLKQLGDPGELADRYLAANPMIVPSHADRFVAKLIDAAVSCGTATVVCWLLLWWTKADVPPQTLGVGILLCGALLLGVYTAVSEHTSAQTLGKRMNGLQVVRESGRRMTMGQSIVRQLPIVFSIYVIDAAFTLFTDRRQRAFEILSKTRVVRVTPPEAT